MIKMKIVQKIYNTGVLAVLRVETEKRAREIAQGCLDGGIDVLEVSYTNDNAGDIIKYLDQNFGHELLVGAGTVLDSETARLAILSGAKFIISPNFNEEVALLCNRYQIPYAPGCSDYTTMVRAMDYGASFIKLFPVARYFGPTIIKELKTPLPNMPILSSGGVTLDNAAEWFDNGVDVLGVGSLLTKGNQNEITQNAKALVEIIKKYRN